MFWRSFSTWVRPSIAAHKLLHALFQFLLATSLHHHLWVGDCPCEAGLGHVLVDLGCQTTVFPEKKGTMLKDAGGIFIVASWNCCPSTFFVNGLKERMMEWDAGLFITRPLGWVLAHLRQECGQTLSPSSSPSFSPFWTRSSWSSEWRHPFLFLVRYSDSSDRKGGRSKKKKPF